MQPVLPELSGAKTLENSIGKEYSSADHVMSGNEITELLRQHSLMVGDGFVYEEEIYLNDSCRWQARKRVSCPGSSARLLRLMVKSGS